MRSRTSPPRTRSVPSPPSAEADPPRYPCLHRCVQECMQKVSMSDSRLRFPAEWEPQSAILISWPHVGTDWADRLAEREATCIALVAAISRFQRALVFVAWSAEHTSELHSPMRISNAVFCLKNKKYQTNIQSC